MSSTQNSSADHICHLLSSLDVQKSSNRGIFNCLVSLRTKHLKDAELCRMLVDRGLVKALVLLLQRPNTKIVDITLSILGNLMVEDKPRKQVKITISGPPKSLKRLCKILQFVHYYQRNWEKFLNKIS